MSAIAAIVLPDAAATPVNHTFSPVTIVNEVAKWADRSGGISVGFPVITHSLRQPNKTSRSYKAQIKLVLPVLEITSPSTGTGIQPAPTKGYDLVANLEFVMPERSTLQQRKDLLKFVQGLLSSVPIVATIEQYESVY